MEKQGGLAFGFRKTATAVIKPDGWMDGWVGGWVDRQTDRIICYKMFLIFLQRLCEIVLILRIIKWDNVITEHRSSCQVPVILVRFERNLYFTGRFSKNSRKSISHKSVHWQPIYSMSAYSQTDRHDEYDSRFSQLCKLAYIPIDEVCWANTYRQCLIGQYQGYNTDRHIGISRLLLNLIRIAITDTWRKYPQLLEWLDLWGKTTEY
jgi:hypothetical protein